jgi:hypothetical protein
MISCTKSDSNIKNDISQEKLDNIELDNYQKKEIIEEERDIIETIKKYEISNLYSFATSCIFSSLSMYDEEQYGFFFDFILSFDNEDNKYFFTPDGPGGGPWAAGTFFIKNNSILLVPEELTISETFLNDTRWTGTIDILNNPWELEYIEIDNSKFFTKGLKGKNITFGAFEAERHDYYGSNKMQPKVGEHRKVNDIEIVLKGSALGYLLENAKVRSGPGISYDFYKIEEAGFRAIDYLAKGEKVIIIGQTLFEDVINEQHGHWYYCRLILDEYTNLFIDENTYNNKRFVWIFAPLVDYYE